MTVEELCAIYDGRASFYGKAHVLRSGKKEELQSYETIVACIRTGKKPVVYGLYSQTTTRHIKEFLRQRGYKADTARQIMRDYGEKKGTKRK